MLMELDVDQEYYTEFARQTVIECLEHKMGKKLSGCNGSYVKMDETWGVKFSSTDNMHRNFQRQLRAAEFGLGPRCFGYFTYTTKRGHTFGCYVTENAETICEPGDSEEFDEDNEYNEDAVNLVKEMKMRTGFYFSDCHTANVGYLRGRMVCIDFGHMSHEE